MKGYFLFFLSMILVVSSTLNAEGASFRITGIANNMHGERLVLTYVNKAGNIQTDTTLITKNGFAFTGEISHCVWMRITLIESELGEEKETRMFFVDTGAIRIELSYENFYTANVLGSATDDSFAGFCFKQDTLQNRIYDVSVLLRHITKDSAARLEIELATLEAKKKQNSIDFIKHNTVSVAAAYVLMSKIYEWDDSVLEALYLPLEFNVKNTSYGKLVHKRLQVSKGMSAPSFESLTFDKSWFSLSQQLKRSEFVMLVFWASWCKPCRQEMPFLKDLLTKYSSQGLAIVGIATHDKSEMWEKAIRADESISFVHILDKSNEPSSIGALYSVMPIPTIILLNKAGKIIYRQLGESITELEKVMQQCFFETTK
jgi:thiol-disulfide isomerase/thioredoxin